jgi:hypothetical protein
VDGCKEFKILQEGWNAKGCEKERKEGREVRRNVAKKRREEKDKENKGKK